MANPEHLAILKQGADAWNMWREDNPEILPDLRHLSFEFPGVELRGINLKRALLQSSHLELAQLQRADFRGANIEGANLRTAQIEGADLEGTILRGADLSGVNLIGANLDDADLSGARITMARTSESTHFRRCNFANANLIGLNLAHGQLQEAVFTGADLRGTIFAHANLTSATFEGAAFKGNTFEGARLEHAVLSGCDLRALILIDANLDNANLSGVRLWQTRHGGWSINGVICEYAFWDREGKERTDYAPGEFERLHAEGVRVELLYGGGIRTIEISTLPFLIMHLEEAFAGCALRLKSIQDAPGGARVTFVVEETGGADPATIQAQLEEEGRRLQAATRALLLERQSKQQLEEDFGRFKERVLPILLQEAELSFLPQTTKTFHAAVLFSDLSGFSKLNDSERAEALQLLRGILKPILSRWNGENTAMWGDALRVTFRDVNDALDCACRIQATVAAQGFSQRMGMDHGKITERYNPTIDCMDIEGDAVNMAARLEPLAVPGEVLVSENLRYHPDIKEERFTFTGSVLALKKAVGDHPAGAEVTCYVVSLSC